MDQAPQSRLKELITKGKEQGYLTFAEVNDHLPQDIIDSDQVEDIIRMINDMGIQVFENAPDSDTLMMSEANTDDDAAEEAAAAAAAASGMSSGATIAQISCNRTSGWPAAEDRTVTDTAVSLGFISAVTTSSCNDHIRQPRSM